MPVSIKDIVEAMLRAWRQNGFNGVRLDIDFDPEYWTDDHASFVAYAELGPVFSDEMPHCEVVVDQDQFYADLIAEIKKHFGGDDRVTVTHHPMCNEFEIHREGGAE